MSIETRVANLEQLQGKDEDRILQGVLYFHEHAIIVNGIEYDCIESIPMELREKYASFIPVA